MKREKGSLSLVYCYNSKKKLEYKKLLFGVPVENPRKRNDYKERTQGTATLRGSAAS